MKTFYYSLFILTLFLCSCKHQKSVTTTTTTNTNDVQSSDQTKVPNDMQVIVTEDMLNKCLKALGPISGKEPYDITIIKDTFTWVLKNSLLHLQQGKATFTTDVTVIAGALTYTTPCVGDVSIWFDRKKNLINVKIMHCFIDIYTKVWGIKYHITTYDLAGQFKDPFTFAGPTATSTEEDMEMPDGSIRKLYMVATDSALVVEDKKIIVSCEIAFSLTPPAANGAK